MFNIKWNGNQVIKETTSGLFKKEIGYNEQVMKEQEKLKVEAENKVRLAEYSLQEKELQAKANEIESNSLSPQLLRKMAIEKWDGKLPQVQGNNGSTLINLD